MTKLLVLSECRESASIDESALSYAKRELGAAVTYFATQEAANRLVDDKPDVVVYRSTLNRERMLSDETLRWIKSKARLVLWCSESSSPHYADLLRHYRDERLFDLRVGTDGGSEAAFQENLYDWATLWPCDPDWYWPTVQPDGKGEYLWKHPEKDINLGFGGSIGDGRRPLIQSFGDALTVRERKAGNGEEFDHYGSYAAWLMRCRAVVNDATLDGGYAVKNRVIEAGLAGCLLFEIEGSPLPRWGFKAGQDYLVLEHNNPAAVALLPDYAEICARFGERLRHKVAEFHPSKFWQQVIG